MEGRMKSAGLLFILILLVSCAIAPSEKSIQTAIAQTQIAFPATFDIQTNTITPPLLATIASGFGGKANDPNEWVNKYEEISCRYEPPERFTSSRCFDLAPTWTGYTRPIGVLLYSKGVIGQIQVSRCGTKKAASDICAQFLIDVATSAGWNLDDVSGAMTLVAKSKEGEWITYNTITSIRQEESYYFEGVQ